MIKVREAAQGWIDGLPIEQFLHGPLVARQSARGKLRVPSRFGARWPLRVPTAEGPSDLAQSRVGALQAEQRAIREVCTVSPVSFDHPKRGLPPHLEKSQKSQHRI